MMPVDGGGDYSNGKATSMDDSTRRIVVDGIDFSQVFFFPRIFKSIASALQPGRMIIALIMVVALLAGGRMWDQITTAGIHPEGLMSGTAMTDAQRERLDDRLQNTLQSAMRQYVPQDQWPEGAATGDWPVLHTSTVKRQIAREFRIKRAALAPDADIERRTADDRYASTLGRINEDRWKGAYEASARHVQESIRRIIQAGSALSISGMLIGTWDLLVITPRALWDQAPWFTIAYGLFFVVVFTLGGGAISRIAACDTALSERVAMREAVDFSFARWGRLIMALLTPLIMAGILIIVLMLLGLLLAPVLNLLGGPLYILSLLVGFALAFLLIGFVLSQHMLIPAVCCEDCDSTDAGQRAFAYLVTRPLHLLGYVVVALFGLVIGFWVVSTVVGVMLGLTADSSQILIDSPALDAPMVELLNRSGEERANHDLAWHESWAGGFITFWQTLLIDVIWAYVVAYYFSASTTIYMLMRRTVDGQPMSAIWQPGLVPGTLAPMPEPIRNPADDVDAADDEQDSSG
jgi:hypothetical protein